tara:strand:+ start:515 stop:1033 length:519 start_codon:yes stop_codon:yes gene_type:complete
MRNTSLAKVTHEEILNLERITTTLAGLPPVEFDKQVRPLREYLETFNEDGKLAEMMLVDNVTNHLIDGLYVRELLIPIGAVILSRVHKRPLVNIISKGRVIVIDTNGEKEYTAPCTFISKAGTQRFVYAPEETVWNTAHLTDVTNPDDLVDDLTFDNYEEFISYSHQLTQKE